ncbi:MAG: ATP-binding protein [Armatimonadetes bacterium]|nr:ATP-binding protein [Armatimonadota bacterium]
MYLESLKIENIKAFKTLELDFKRPDSGDYAGMNVFVGGNGSGKSTLLKCIAMALAGRDVARQLIVMPEGWVSQGERQGSIRLAVGSYHMDDQFNGQDIPPVSPLTAILLFEPHTLETVASRIAQSDIIPDKVLWKPEILVAIANESFYPVITPESGLWDSTADGWFFSGYGALRRLTGSSIDADRYSEGGRKLSSCITLFREDAALSVGEAWLKQEYAREAVQQIENGVVASSSLVKSVVSFLNDGLLPEGFAIKRVTLDDVYMETPNGGELPMRDLSDGCRTAYALILDIIRNMTAAYGTTEIFGTDAEGRVVVDKPGVILIDELEAHLHPAWQQTICEWLKTRFPKVQFFVTTHSPLIAQAADAGGIYVLPLPGELEKGQEARQLSPLEQERIRLGRAEEVLLGDAFELKHTWGMDAEHLVQRWNTLARKKNGKGSLNAEEQGEYDTLKRKLAITFHSAGS